MPRTKLDNSKKVVQVVLTLAILGGLAFAAGSIIAEPDPGDSTERSRPAAPERAAEPTVP